ncbi:Transcription factor bye1, partial [Rhizina undulata]
MAEPRRSGRSTKGQNSRFSDIGPENDTPIPVAPKSKKSKSSPAPPASSTRPPAEPADGKAEGQAEDAGKEENAPDDIIRCVCGAKEEDENRDRMMIQCDGCDAWQHTLCMSIPRRKIPKEYFCEVCKPENHQVLLEKMARGEKPWEKKPKGAASKVKKDVKENTPIRTSSRSARKASTPVLDLKESDTPLIHKVTKELPAEPAPPAMEKKPVKPQSQKKTTEKLTKTKTTEQAKKKENEKEVEEEAMEMESEKPIEKPVEKAGDMPFDKVEQEKETETEKGDKGGEQQKELELANETLGQHVVLGSTNIAQKMPGSSQIVTSTEPQLNVMPETEKVIATNGASPNASAPAAVAEVTKVSPGDDHHTPAKPKARKNTSKDKPPSRVIKEKLARPVKRKAQAEPPAEHKNNDEQKAHDTPRRISVGTREQKPVERRQSIAVPARK